MPVPTAAAGHAHTQQRHAVVVTFSSKRSIGLCLRESSDGSTAGFRISAAGYSTVVGPSSTTTILGRFQVSLPHSNDIFCVFKPSARTHTAAPHCGSHCHQLRVLLTLQFSVAAGRHEVHDRVAVTRLCEPSHTRGTDTACGRAAPTGRASLCRADCTPAQGWHLGS